MLKYSGMNKEKIELKKENWYTYGMPMPVFHLIPQLYMRCNNEMK